MTKKTFTLIRPICGYEFEVPYEWRYQDFSQECPNCENQFHADEDDIKDD